MAYDSSSNNPYSYYSRMVRSDNAKKEREDRKRNGDKPDHQYGGGYGSGGNFQRHDYQDSDYE